MEWQLWVLSMEENGKQMCTLKAYKPIVLEGRSREHTKLGLKTFAEVLAGRNYTQEDIQLTNCLEKEVHSCGKKKHFIAQCLF